MTLGAGLDWAGTERERHREGELKERIYRFASWSEGKGREEISISVHSSRGGVGWGAGEQQVESQGSN